MEKCENIAKILLSSITATNGHNGIKTPSHRPESSSITTEKLLSSPGGLVIGQNEENFHRLSVSLWPPGFLLDSGQVSSLATQSFQKSLFLISGQLLSLQGTHARCTVIQESNVIVRHFLHKKWSGEISIFCKLFLITING